jgi:hypothetical protein
VKILWEGERVLHQRPRKTYAGTYALDIRGMNGLFGDETQLANKLRQRIMTTGFLANVAVAEKLRCRCLPCSWENGHLDSSAWTGNWTTG